AWGWHPLTDEWAARIVADAGVRPGELVLDIGAGRGALTRPLVAAGARVLAVEPHPGRASYLRERFAGHAVTVVEAGRGGVVATPPTVPGGREPALHGVERAGAAAAATGVAVGRRRSGPAAGSRTPIR